MESQAKLGWIAYRARRVGAPRRPGGPARVADAWARRWLKPGEAELWARLPGPDRRAAVAAAHRVASRLGDPDGAGVPRAVLAAALLQDIGKIDSGLGPVRRLGVDALAAGLGRDRVAGWGDRPAGWRRRAGRYVRHDEIGRELLRAAGSDALAADWAGEHHRAPHTWTVEARVGRLLKAASGE